MRQGWEGNGPAGTSGAGRWVASAVIAVLVDAAVFLAATAMGAALELAQAVGFASALGAAFAACAVSGGAACRPGFASSAVTWTIAMLAFAMHAGVLHLLVVSLHVPPWAAVVAAAMSGVAAVALPWRLLPRPLAAGATLSAAQWAALAWLVMGFVTAIRLVYIGQMELFPQEAYYWNFARRLDIGYLDHPPLAAWLVAAATVLGDSEFAVRLPAVACAAVTAFFAWRLGRDLGGRAIAWGTAILATVLPYYLLAGTLMTPDAPLAAAWAAALYYLGRALLRDEGTAWIAAGIAIGAGMLSKYTMILVPLAALAFVMLDARARRVLRSPWPWAGAAAALLVFSPVVVWNVRHDWASFAFQGSRRLAPQQAQFELHLYLAYALAVVTPWAVVGALRGWMRGTTGAVARSGAAIAEVPHGRARLFAAVFTVVPLVPLAIASMWTETKTHWTGPVWLAALPLAAVSLSWTPGSGPRAGRVDRALARSWPALLHAVMLLHALVFFYYAVYGFAGARAHHRFVDTGWRALRLQVQDIEDETLRETGRRPAVIGMDKHYVADMMSFYDPRGDGPADTASRNVVLDADALMYELWFSPRDFAGRDLVLVACDRDTLEDGHLAPQAQRLGPVHALPAGKGGRAGKTCFARVLYGFTPAAGSSSGRRR